MKITKDVRYLCDKLENDGFEAWVVGGCVRDFYMNKTPSDYDITTNATYDQIKECFGNSVKEIEYGTSKEFNVFVCRYNHKQYEIATFREDKEYNDHRHPITEITSTIEKDLSRRDFTINSLAYRPATDTLLDLYNGIGDIDHRVIRSVGHPSKRIEEDALRILRAYRFATTLNFTISDQLYDVCKYHYGDILKYCSPERISNELLKGLRNLNNITYVNELFGIIKEFDPEHREPLHNKFVLRLVRNSHSDIQRLAAILSYLEEDVEETLRNLHFSVDVIEQVKFLCKYRLFDITTLQDKAELKKWLRDKRLGLVYELLEYADNIEKLKGEDMNMISAIHDVKNKLCSIVQRHEPFTLRDLKINGDDLIELGYRGPAVGLVLDNLLDKVCEYQELNDRITLISMAKGLRNVI